MIVSPLNHHTAGRCRLMLNPDAKKFCKSNHPFTSIYDCKAFLQNFSTGSNPLMQVPDAIRCKMYHTIAIAQSIPR
jgi:hypothetical protein